MRNVTTLVQIVMISVALWGLLQSYRLWSEGTNDRFSDVDALARQRRQPR